MSKRKLELIDLLLKDFKQMFPDSSPYEKREVSFRLQGMDETDLELLAKGVLNETTN